MITVQNVTKSFGKTRAVDNVSFKIEKGEIVGFLGPNGAGKTTLMRMLTGYLPPAEGKVIVAGHDITIDAMAAKRKIGYLPETPPLYPDMTVKDFLRFAAKIKDIPAGKLNATVEETLEKCHIADVKNQVIATLSKGYRQRVGMAQAIIHDPEVLILDEPTSGLDPNQLVEIRHLIKTIGKEKTVMLSTHIMQEVEAICDRVIIIKKGKIVADNSASELQHEVGQQVIYAEFDGAISKNVLQKIPGVSKVQKVTDTTFLIESQGTEDLRKLIAIYAQQNNLLLITLRIEEKSLEEVFKELTR